MCDARRRALLAALAFAPALRAQDIEVLPLKYRTAEEVLPQLRAFLEPGGALTGQGYQLFVRASSANVRQLKQMLAALDRAPRELVISVRQRRAEERATRVVGADGSVTIGTRDAAAGARVEAREGRTFATADSAQTIRVLEGGRAHIAIGTSIPLAFRRWVIDASGATEVQGTVYYDAVTGFYARARLLGDAVTVELEPEQTAATPDGPERARLATTVRGRLGEWIAVGGADAHAAADASAQSSQRGVWLKVDAADRPR